MLAYTTASRQDVPTTRAGWRVLLRPDPEERRPAPAASSKVRHEWLQLEGQAAGARGGEPLRAGKIGARVTKKAAARLIEHLVQSECSLRYGFDTN